MASSVGRRIRTLPKRFSCEEFALGMEIDCNRKTRSASSKTRGKRKSPTSETKGEKKGKIVFQEVEKMPISQPECIVPEPVKKEPFTREKEASSHLELENDPSFVPDLMHDSHPSSPSSEQEAAASNQSHHQEHEIEHLPAEPEKSEYELHREKQMERNRLLLEQLGIFTLKGSMAPTQPQTTPKKSSKPKKPREELERRQSPRLKGKPGAPLVDGVQHVIGVEKPTPKRGKKNSNHVVDPAATTFEELVEEESEESDNTKPPMTRMLWLQKKKPGLFSKKLPDNIQLPAELKSINGTLYSLGTLYDGPNIDNYKTPTQCIFQHEYPIGYRATRPYWGKVFDMTILEGEKGPLFQITDTTTGTVYTGITPTNVWTQICLKEAPATRVGGPLFWGFNDPVTQTLFKNMMKERDEAKAAATGSSETTTTTATETVEINTEPTA